MIIPRYFTCIYNLKDEETRVYSREPDDRVKIEIHTLSISYAGISVHYKKTIIPYLILSHNKLCYMSLKIRKWS